MPKSTKLNIKNTDRVVGLNMLGISISDWMTSDDRYDFLVHDSNGNKWMFILNRYADSDKKYTLGLFDVGERLALKITAGEIRIKRLFYKAILELVIKVNEKINKI